MGAMDDEPKWPLELPVAEDDGQGGLHGGFTKDGNSDAKYEVLPKRTLGPSDAWTTAPIDHRHDEIDESESPIRVNPRCAACGVEQCLRCGRPTLPGVPCPACNPAR